MGEILNTFNEHLEQNSVIAFRLLSRLQEEFVLNMFESQYVFTLEARLDWMSISLLGEELWSHWHGNGLIDEEEAFKYIARGCRMYLEHVGEIAEYAKERQEEG